MTIRVVRIESGSGDGVLRRLHVNVPMRAELVAARAEPQPVVFALCVDDVAFADDCAELLDDCGTRHRARQLHKILLGRKRIPLLRTEYQSAARFRGAVEELHERAIARRDDNLFLIAVSASVFAQLWTPATVQSSAQSLRPPFESEMQAEYNGLIAMLQVLPVSSAVQDAFLGGSQDARLVRQGIVRLAPHAQAVLLIGETGTGKDVAARAIHKESGRQGAFVVVDCANIPRDLLQSELFGVEKGAYTDAKESRDGLWQRAKGGTLFLDEVHQLTLEHQARLLRAIETGEIRPVGKTEPTKVDARVIAATNCNLQEMVRDGTFRADLYFRLHYLIIETPPLRHHLEDLPILANHFWRSLTGDPSASLPGEVLEELAGFDWLGNNRDLHGALTTLFAMVGTSGLSRSHVRAWLKAAAWASEGGRGAPPDVRALEQYPNECARHLRRADRVMRGAQIQVRDVMNGAPATEPVRHAIATSTMNCVQELELLCETPVLFHGKFEKVRAVKNHLRTFAHMFPERSDEALKFWKEKLEPAFSEAYAAIIDALDELHDAKYAADAARRRRRSREAGTGRPTDPEQPRPLLR